ncbi:hypothetical protein [Trinickia fusca]|uniref:Uncharacterized protein n=1 Tax=Trinickia fusca TaxID=2419777 RepID=A0A494XL08_9BURK|nr:hypothetical protein [Trinickia fusca]RKP49346.1 hypothetical protein D7S89_11295 [Trinickia fusca]
MDELTYTKGIYTATPQVRHLDNGQYQGVVSLARDDGADAETSLYEAKTTSPSAHEALEEAKALAHQILGELEL